jgi:hypothetical protein
MHIYRLSLYEKHQGKLNWVQDVTFQSQNSIEKHKRDLEVGDNEFKLILAEYFGLDYDPIGGDQINMEEKNQMFHEINITDLSKARAKMHQEIKEVYA